MTWNSVWIFDLGATIYSWFTANPTWRESCAQLAERLPAGGRLRVVDLGCGPGVSAIAVAQRRPGARVVGLDLAWRMLRVARGQVAAASLGERVWLAQADALRLPLVGGSLDAVTGHSFLYLLVTAANRAEALGEMLRALRPGGRLVLMEPSARPASVAGVLRFSRHPRHLLAVGLWRPFSRVHGRFSPDSLAGTLEQAGFIDCHVEETMGGLGLLAWAEKPD